MLRLPGILRMEVHKVLRLLRLLHMEVHKVLRLPQILRVKKQVNTPSTMEGRTGNHRRQPQTTQQPEPLTEHGGSQIAAPATNSARQETSASSNHNGGTDRRPPQTTADNPTARASNGAWRFTKCCACQEFCAWRFTKCCACHEFCTSRNK